MHLIITHLNYDLTLVGYSNKVANNTDKGVSKMLSGSFVNVGKDGVHLTDLKFTGYQNASAYQTAGTGNSFYMAKLSTSGAFEHQYYWKDTYDESTGTWAGGYWYDSKTDKIIEKDTDDDVEITRGNGFWCSIGRNRKADNICLVSSGEVLVLSQAVLGNDTDKGVSKSICNPMPVSCKLTEVSFTGYQNASAYQTAGTGNSFYMAKLSSSGAFEHQYYWKDTYDESTGTWAGGYWYDSKTDKIIEKDTDDDITIEPGDGFWCSIGRNRKSGNIYIVWPKVPGMAE